MTPAILFVTSNRVGDAVLSTGLLARAIERQPQARIWVVCGRATESLFSAMPHVERLVAVEKKRFARHWWDVYRACSGRTWEWIIDLRNVPALRLLTTRRRTVAADRNTAVHKVVELSNLLGSDILHPRIWLTEAARKRAEELLPGHRQTLVFGPAASNPVKEWPPENFVSLAHRLLGPGGTLAGARLVLLAGAVDRRRFQPLLDALSPFNPMDLMGAASVLEACAALERATLFVGNDSGPMHMAAVVGAPTLGLFGLGSPTVYAPWGPRAGFLHRPIDADAARDMPMLEQLAGGLMSRLTVDLVAETAEKIVNGAEFSRSGTGD